MDKKTSVRFGFSALFILLLMFGYMMHAKQFSKSIEITKDEKRFKEEYESLNGKERQGKEYKNMEISVPSDNHVVYASKKQILDMLENGTGIIYFGFPDCPWCRNVVPVLIDTIKEEKVEKLYYYNAKEERDEKSLIEGKIVETKKGSAFYTALLEKLGEKASIYDGLENDEVKRLYFPTVLFVKNGTIVFMHEGSVSSQEDPLIPLNQKQQEELKNKFIEGINSVYGSVCDDKC